MKKYTVYLYRSPNCVRGWLAYLRPEHAITATFTVDLWEFSGAKAKNRAITLANKGFRGLEIVGRNFDHKIWGINNFPELMKRFAYLK